MRRSNKWVNEASRSRAGSFVFSRDNSTCLIYLDRLARGHRGGIVTGKISVMSDATVVDEALSAREIIPPTIQADKLDKDTVRLSPDNHRASLFFGGGISTGEGLQFSSS
jgi:hypothetical protein